MRIRRDAVFLSSVLFTIAFLLLVPPSWRYAQSGHPSWHFGREAQEVKAALESLRPESVDSLVLQSQIGVANLAVILAVLIVVWKGYVKKLRWTWFFMCVIVWAWFFPTVLPVLAAIRDIDVLGFLVSWIDPATWTYGLLTGIWIFLLMLVALILPVRSFFRKQSD